MALYKQSQMVFLEVDESTDILYQCCVLLSNYSHRIMHQEFSHTDSFNTLAPTLCKQGLEWSPSMQIPRQTNAWLPVVSAWGLGLAGLLHENCNRRLMDCTHHSCIIPFRGGCVAFPPGEYPCIIIQLENKQENVSLCIYINRFTSAHKYL
jgi:hypothetical protein